MFLAIKGRVFLSPARCLLTLTVPGVFGMALKDAIEVIRHFL